MDEIGPSAVTEVDVGKGEQREVDEWSRIQKNCTKARHRQGISSEQAAEKKDPERHLSDDDGDEDHDSW